MNRKINKIKLYVKESKKAYETSIKLSELLLNNNYEIVDNNYNLAISIGGDGTFLKMIHANDFNDSILYIGINAGSVGFLAEIEIDNLLNFIDKINNNDYYEKELNILETNVFHDNKTNTLYSLNELVIKNNNYSLLKGDIYIENQLLEHFTGDGILISTPSGSTAYNMSCNGSIIDPEINAFSITPIAPINNILYKTITNGVIISNNKKIEFLLNNKNKTCIQNDGILINLDNIDKIISYISTKKIKTITLKENDFIKRINTKIIGE